MQTFFRASSLLPIPSRPVEKQTLGWRGGGGCFYLEPEIRESPVSQKNFWPFEFGPQFSLKIRRGAGRLPWIRHWFKVKQPRVDKTYLAFFVLLGFLFGVNIRLNRGTRFKSALILTCKRTSLNHWGYKVYPLNLS